MVLDETAIDNLKILSKYNKKTDLLTIKNKKQLFVDKNSTMAVAKPLNKAAKLMPTKHLQYLRNQTSQTAVQVAHHQEQQTK